MEYCNTLIRYAESHNARAHATYRKCGMAETDYRIFEIDYVIARAGGDGSK